MKLMFEFPATEHEYLQVVGDAIHYANTGLLLSRQQFEPNSEIFFDLGFSTFFHLTRGRAFINSERDVRKQMTEVHKYLEKLFARKIPTLSYNPADTWRGSTDWESYVRRTSNYGLAGLSGCIW